MHMNVRCAATRGLPDNVPALVARCGASVVVLVDARLTVEQACDVLGPLIEAGVSGWPQRQESA